MKNGILGFIAGIMVCICLASTTDMMVFRPAKPTGIIIRRFVQVPEANTYVTEMFLKGWQLQQIEQGNYGIVIVIVKY